METTEAIWRETAKRFIKAELKRRDITYLVLAKRLTQMGLAETPASIAMKISRGTFPGWFLMAVIDAIGVELRVVPAPDFRAVL